MGLNFRKSIKICKGVSLNLSKSGVGVSVGTKGARASINTSGRSSVKVGIPGTGLSYTASSGSKKKTAKKRSYSSSARKKQEALAKKKEALAQQKATELEQNRLKVEEHENYLELIRSVHKECEEPIDWKALRDAPAPFVKGQPGPAEQETAAQLADQKPGFMSRLFGGAEKQQRDQEAALEAAKAADAEAYTEWEESKTFAERILKGDTDAYLEAIETANPFEDFADYGSDLEFGTDQPGRMEIEFRVLSKDVVPEQSLSLTQTGKLSEKAMTKTAYFDIMQDYVCSAAIRLGRELFSVLPVDYVMVHAVDGVLDTSTGNDEEFTLLSVLFTREGFEGCNFDRIDPSDFVERFQHNMSFAKTTGFHPVPRLEWEE